ncbi:tenascin-X, partial [Caerostris extrusa]
PCQHRDCSPNGFCNVVFCVCQKGSSGDFCEIIDECHSKVVDCGNDTNVKCKLGNGGKAFCECEDPQQGFDYTNKVCKDCECGREARKGCEFRNGVKQCNCLPNYVQDNNECRECKCSYGSYGCKFHENGEKTCLCRKGYAQRYGE